MQVKIIRIYPFFLPLPSSPVHFSSPQKNLSIANFGWFLLILVKFRLNLDIFGWFWLKMAYFWQIMANFGLNSPNLPLFFPKFPKFDILLPPARVQNLILFTSSTLPMADIYRHKKKTIAAMVPEWLPVILS